MMLVKLDLSAMNSLLWAQKALSESFLLSRIRCDTTRESFGAGLAGEASGEAFIHLESDQPHDLDSPPLQSQVITQVVAEVEPGVLNPRPRTPTP